MILHLFSEYKETNILLIVGFIYKKQEKDYSL